MSFDRPNFLRRIQENYDDLSLTLAVAVLINTDVEAVTILLELKFYVYLQFV